MTNEFESEIDPESDYGFFCDLETSVPYIYVDKRLRVRYRAYGNNVDEPIHENRVPTIVYMFYTLVIVRLVVWTVFGIVKKVV